jgi:hypothetical protein
MKTVFVCSGSPVLSQGLRIVAKNEFSVRGLFESFAAMEDLLTTEPPDILVAEMSPAITFEALRHLRAVTGKSQIVLWFDSITPEFVSACLSLGIRGVISKSASAEAHVRCLHEVSSGRLWIDQALTNSLMTARAVHLTPREKVYLSRLLPKVPAYDRFELALMGLKNIASNSVAGSAPVRMPGQRATPLAFPETIQKKPVTVSNPCAATPKRVLQMPRRVRSVIAPGPLRPVYASAQH